MASARKRSPHKKGSQQSNFILCPTCNKSFSYTTIDIHVGNCCLKTNNDSALGTSANKDRRIDNYEGSLGGKRKREELNSKVSEVDATVLEESKTSSIARKMSFDDESSTPPYRKNAFRELLQSSRKIFKEDDVTRHHFYLTEDGDDFSLAWTCQESEVSKLSEIKWSETVIFHASDEETKQGIQKISVVLETSIPSEEPFHRPVYVQKHSKFSVPVLKSILQKSIRRRRPMPSVRIAMELVDKAFNELLRRLPIIILEDAFLHNDFPFLVWLMAAESKNYVPPKRLIDKVLQIVLEVASCPWKDEPNQTQEQFNGLYNPSETMAFEDDAGQCNLMLRSMSMRKKYGGMNCDKVMIDKFVSLWTERYRMRYVEPSISQIICQPLADPMLWKDVPSHLYRRTIQSSANLLLTLQKIPLPLLTKHDICPSGIDFHCSNILNILFRPTCQFYLNLRAMYKDNTDEDLENLTKKIMWDCSSGVNNRRIITTGESCTKFEEDHALKSLWDHYAYPLVQQFTDNYIDTRLASG